MKEEFLKCSLLEVDEGKLVVDLWDKNICACMVTTP